MDQIVFTKSLRTVGLDSHEISRMRQRGDLVPVRRGAYARDRPDDQTAEQAHRRLILATVPQLEDGAVLSHASAAVLHGLPTWSSAIDRMHVTRDRSGGGRRRPVVHVHGAPLRAQDLAVVDGIAVTSVARTVLDLARTVPMEQAVAAGDRALALGLSPL
jgi:predicted transcriptional regulator of viral defense system